MNGFKELFVTKNAIIIRSRQEATDLIHVTITSKHGGLEWRFCSTTSQIRNSTRRTGKNGLFLVSIHLMRPRLSLTMFYFMETTFIFALDFHVFYILHKARTCISRCFVYICLTVHTVLVIVNSHRFLCRASHHESTKARKTVWNGRVPYSRCWHFHFNSDTFVDDHSKLSDFQIRIRAESNSQDQK